MHIRRHLDLVQLRLGGGSLHPHAVHSTTSVMTPEPTVLPPSRMAKWLPISRATGLSRLTITAALSPGNTIDTPSGSCISPVTFVVRKKNCGLYPPKNGACPPPPSLR